MELPVAKVFKADRGRKRKKKFSPKTPFIGSSNKNITFRRRPRKDDPNATIILTLFGPPLNNDSRIEP